MFEFTKDVPVQRELLGLGRLGQYLMHIIGDVSDLDHSDHNLILPQEWVQIALTLADGGRPAPSRAQNIGPRSAESTSAHSTTRALMGVRSARAQAHR